MSNPGKATRGKRKFEMHLNGKQSGPQMSGCESLQLLELMYALFYLHMVKIAHVDCSPPAPHPATLSSLPRGRPLRAPSVPSSSFHQLASLVIPGE